MKLLSQEMTYPTSGQMDLIDLSPDIRSFVTNSGIADGLVTIFTPGSTAGVTTIEYETGALEDLRRAICRLAPENQEYAHDQRWGDGNGYSHVRAALLGPSMSIPVSEGQCLLGTWQQAILIDFDNRPRRRRVVFQAIGI